MDVDTYNKTNLEKAPLSRTDVENLLRQADREE
jgi:hypothetical protein